MEDLDFVFMVKQIYDAAVSGQFPLVVAAGLVVVVFLFRTLAAPHISFFKTDEGGVLLTFLGALGGGLSSALIAGEAFNGWVAAKAFQIAFLAMGGYSALKKLVGPGIAFVRRVYGSLKNKLQGKGST